MGGSPKSNIHFPVGELGTCWDRRVWRVTMLYYRQGLHTRTELPKNREVALSARREVSTYSRLHPLRKRGIKKLHRAFWTDGLRNCTVRSGTG